RDVSRAHAERTHAIDADRHLRDDRHRRIHLPRRQNRLLDLIEIAKRLGDEQINAALGERLHLLLEVPPRFIPARGTIWFDANAKRSNRTRDENAVTSSAASELRRGNIELA